MNRQTYGEIRKLSVGAGDQPWVTFQVGNRGGRDGTISRIERNENEYYLHGSLVYVIYVKGPTGEERPWKMLENQPVVVEFNGE
jgi:hypothetical protein